MSDFLSQNQRKCLVVLFAAAITGYSILGSVSSGLVVILALAGFVLHSGGKITFVRPVFITKWAIIILVFVFVGGAIASYHFISGDGFGDMLSRGAFLGFLPLVALLSQLNREELLNAVEKSASVIPFIVLLLVLGVYDSPLDRIELEAGNPGPFAVTMAVNYAICLFAFARRKASMRSSIYLIAAFLAVICIFLSGMRTMLPIVFLIPFLAWRLSRSNRSIKLNMKTGFAFVLMTLCVILVLYWVLAPRLYMVVSDLQNLKAQNNFDTSLGQRLVMWDYAISIFPKSPWLGYGTTEMSRELAIFSKAEYGFTVSKTHLHNFVLNALLVGGLFELLVLLLFLAAPILFMWKLDGSDNYIFYGKISALAITFIFLSSGALNILFSHDIMDTLYLSSMALCARMGIKNEQSS